MAGLWVRGLCNAVHNGSGGKTRNQKIYVSVVWPLSGFTLKSICFPESTGASHHSCSWALWGKSSKTQFLLVLEIILKVNNTRYHYLKKAWALTFCSETFYCCTQRGLIMKSFIQNLQRRWRSWVVWPRLRGRIEQFHSPKAAMNSKTDFCYKMDFCLLPAYKRILTCKIWSFQRACYLFCIICNSTNCNVNFPFLCIFQTISWSP